MYPKYSFASIRVGYGGLRLKQAAVEEALFFYYQSFHFYLVRKMVGSSVMLVGRRAADKLSALGVTPWANFWLRGERDDEHLEYRPAWKLQWNFENTWKITTTTKTEIVGVVLKKGQKCWALIKLEIRWLSFDERSETFALYFKWKTILIDQRRAWEIDRERMKTIF